MRILIAEDDLACRRHIQKFLSSYGECDVTIDGMEALDAFIIAFDAGVPYNLVCLDIMMPKVDGLKVLNTIRELENVRKVKESERTKIIILTAIGYVDQVAENLKTDLDAYINKPVTIESLSNVMKKWQNLN